MLSHGSDVVVNSSFSRKLLTSPIIYKKSLADLVTKSRQISQRTGNPVYFVKNDKCKGKEHVIELTRSARDLNLNASPFYNPKVVKTLLENYRDSLWNDEWVNSGSYHSMTNHLSYPIRLSNGFQALPQGQES